MIDLVNQLLNTIFYFNYYENKYPKGEPYVHFEFQRIGPDITSKGELDYDVSYDYYDFSVKINDNVIENASEKENFEKLQNCLQSLFSKIHAILKSKEITDHKEISRIKILLQNHLDNYCTFEFFGYNGTEILCWHNNLCIIPDNLKKYNRDNSYYQFVCSEYLIVQKQFVSILLTELNQNYFDPGFDQDKPMLKWKGSDTDLLELIVALLETDSLRDKDGCKLSRKDAIVLFEEIFSVKIKDAESKLSRATERKLNCSPFLSSLKESFENYSKSKVEKEK